MANELMFRNDPVSFGERLATSGSFKTLFRDGMALVEETAAYLDGEGRDDARALPRMDALAYASESMRLTTRLMQIASWLLLQRAVNEGEMTPAEASADKRRTQTSWRQAPKAGAVPAGLPERLVALIDSSLRLQNRITRLDGLICGDQDPAPALPFGANAVEQQMSRLHDAFCR